MRTRLLWTVRDSYDDYLSVIRQQLKEGQEIEDFPYYIDYESYKNLILDFFHEVALSIIRDNLIFKVPYRLGYLGIKKDKTTSEKRKPIFSLYNKEGKIASHTNMHTDGYYFFYHWDKRSSRYAHFTNMSYYNFIPNRGNDGLIGKRGLAKWIKQCAKDPKMKDYDAPRIIK